MHLRYTNTAILTLLIVLTATGLYGTFYTFNGWLFEVHRIAAWAFIALIPWKMGIGWKSLKRGFSKRFNRSVLLVISILNAVIALTILVLGLLWAWRLDGEVTILYQTILAWHWILALVLIGPLALHIWRRWPKPKAVEFTMRRNVIRSGGLLALGVIGWGAAEALARTRATASAPRIVTGSRGGGEYTGNNFPITGEWAAEVDRAAWRLAVHGQVAERPPLTYADFLMLPQTEIEARLDCTNGWFTTQRWQGVSLMELLARAGIEPGAAFVRIRSMTGYAATFTRAEAREIILATHVGGDPLSHWHGGPLRAVVPNFRGWYWVKWVTSIEARWLPYPDLPGLFQGIPGMSA